MKNLPPVNIDIARELIDFSGSSAAAKSFAEIQLAGSVGLYNILREHQFAYCADEVGMGKTYVAIGVISLMRYFNPYLRVLYIAPRINIQKKWIKEIQNFSANNWKTIDNRVKSIDGTSVNVPILCNSILDYLQRVSINHNQDYILRLSSFSHHIDTARRMAENIDSLKKIAPWLHLRRNQFGIDDKQRFKDMIGQVVNAIIPEYDLLVIDEGHNLKHGFPEKDKGAARNRIIGLAFGKSADENFIDYEPCRRVKRCLILSATPLEYDYCQLWNQMDLVGKGDVAPVLSDEDVGDIEKMEAASLIMVRRLTKVKINGCDYTKNMYRREWRAGGLSEHDYPLIRNGDAKERLIVALIQKKVSEILESAGKRSGRRFSRSFQIGMLSSFESFFQTAKVRSDEGSNFDQTEQTAEKQEKEGIDTASINNISSSYREKFQEELPHPKMDAVAEEAFNSMLGGEKTLVFVRRISSVRDLSLKLAEHYDEWLKNYIIERLDPQLRAPFLEKYNLYVEIKYKNRDLRIAKAYYEISENEEIEEIPAEDIDEVAEKDEGGVDTFFSWFFRGEVDENRLGISFRKNRLDSRNSPFSTIFEDNYLKILFPDSDKLIQDIAAACAVNEDNAIKQIRSMAYTLYAKSYAIKDFQRFNVYHCYQKASLNYLNTNAIEEELKSRSKLLLGAIAGEFMYSAPETDTVVAAKFPAPDEFLNMKTFFTELRRRTDLCNELWPDFFYLRSAHDYRQSYREREERRIILSSAVKLGHPLIDLWIVAVNTLGSLQAERSKNIERYVGEIISNYLDTLEKQKNDNKLSSHRELSLLAANFDLIRDNNFHDVKQKAVANLKNYFADTLGEQTPVGGMHGGVNARMVKQFRMPGYPMVLVTTDVLQEGEDLHTFCRRINHYGLAYTPSSIEQRTGRIDRIGSLSHRRLSSVDEMKPYDKLQVYYPYLDDTYEVVQAHNVFSRINRFMMLVNKTLTAVDDGESLARINSISLKLNDAIAPIEGLLQSPFDVKDELLHLPADIAVHKLDIDSIKKKFKQLITDMGCKYVVKWDSASDADFELYRLGTIFIADNKILLRGEKNSEASRRQPFSLHLKSGSGGTILLKIISPVGKVPKDDFRGVRKIIAMQKQFPRAKICGLFDEDLATYNLSVERDLLFDVTLTDKEELLHAFDGTMRLADIVEKKMLESDEDLEHFYNDLMKEHDHGKD
jgi:hypothetical protein